MNKCTLIVDGNWLLMSRFSVITNKFNKDLPDRAKEVAREELQEQMARSINVILNRFKGAIDNVVIVADGGSWRKELIVPKVLGEIKYKGNRSKTDDLDWSYIYKALTSLLERAQEAGITVSQAPKVEGDDWIWYWSRYLNENGCNALIWSVDKDLQQLVQVVDKDGNRNWTGWYNDKSGLILHEDMQSPQDSIDFFMAPTIISGSLEVIKENLNADPTYIDPSSIVLEKIGLGDNSDNIKAITSYSKGGRTYKLTKKIWEVSLNKFNIRSANDIIPCIEDLADEIYKYPKFEYNTTQIRNMILYNLQLVWLNESVIPESVIHSMVSSEYKQVDMNYILQNYKLLIDRENTIEELFDSQADIDSADAPF